MERATFTVLFFIKRAKTHKDGKLPIYTRITVDGQRAEFVLQASVEEAIWDNKRGRVKGGSKDAKQTNSYLDNIRYKITGNKREFEDAGRQVTALLLRNAYLGLDKEKLTILGIFKDHNEKCQGLINKDFAPGTVQRYKTGHKLLQEFIRLKYNREDMDLNDINPMFINNYEYYLKTARNCQHNTATQYIKNFKKIVRIALANGWMKSDPFRNIKFHLDDVDMAYLDDRELTALIEKKFEIERLQQVKDVYLFCCFSGLAFIDVKNLKYSDIEDKNGKLWIKKRRQKTKNWCSVPILDPAARIMEKYKEHPYCIANGCVLPVMSNQKMNAYLKEIADLCGIKKNLSTHTARHTFATTVTLANQVSMEVVSKMLGHSSVNMTKKYARVVDDLISRDMQKIMGKYGASTGATPPSDLVSLAN